MRALIASGFAVIAVAALIATPVAARSGAGQARVPFTARNGTGLERVPFGERHRHTGSYGYYGPFWTGGIDDSNPENAAPLTQPSPAAETSIPPKPYTPPSVEVAPGGIEIIRGPGSG